MCKSKCRSGSVDAPGITGPKEIVNIESRKERCLTLKREALPANFCVQSRQVVADGGRRHDLSFPPDQKML